jgi:hypothetical protein
MPDPTIPDTDPEDAGDETGVDPDALELHEAMEASEAGLLPQPGEDD